MTAHEALNQLGARALASRWALEPPHPEVFVAAILEVFRAAEALVIEPCTGNHEALKRALAGQ